MHPILSSDLHDWGDAAPQLFFGMIGRMEEDPCPTRYILYQQVLPKSLCLPMCEFVLAFRNARQIGGIVLPRQLYTLAYLYIIKIDTPHRALVLIRSYQLYHHIHIRLPR